MRAAYALLALLSFVAVTTSSVGHAAGGTRATAATSKTNASHRASRALATSSLRPLYTGIDDWPETTGPDAPIAFHRIRQLGASFVRLPLQWDQVAPGGATRPAGFDPANPADPRYNWSAVDREVKGSVAAGLDPVLDVVGAPKWAAPAPRKRAQDGPTRPNVSAFSTFVSAAAKRYSGHTSGLPRVRYWQAWNEPNVSIYLMPQVQGTRIVSAGIYRGLLNAFDTAVHSADPTNVTIAGGLSPFTVRNPAVETVAPLRFLRLLLCISADQKPRPTCAGSVHVDAIAVHPYTSGDPEHSAAKQNDLSLGDLPKLAPILRAASALGHLKIRDPHGSWITEFSWDSKPVDPLGVPMALETRWVAEALYRAWSNGITHFTWYGLRDQPIKVSDFQGGFYFRGKTIHGDRIKPIAAAFRFPFVAYAGAGGISFWGRSAMSTPGAVSIQHWTGHVWRTVETATANRYGIFAGVVHKGTRTGLMRAVTRGRVSPPFSLTRPPDYPVDPLGKTSTG